MTITLYDAVIWSVLLLVVYKIVDYLIRIPKLGNYGQRYILVTGCDSGFGLEISRRLDRRGCHIFSACLTERGEEQLRKTTSNRLTTFHMDVSDPESIARGVEFVSSRLPEGKGLWGVLNNAGVPGLVGPAEWLTRGHYQAVLDVNLLGLIDVSTAFLPLVKRERGRVVNTASMLGRATVMGCTPYQVSKYGVETFSDSLRKQLRPYGVSVHIIEPGFFRTSMADVGRIECTMREAWAGTTQELRDEYGEQYLEQSIENTLKTMIGGFVSDRIDVVIDAYEHALLGRFPRARYLLGYDARFLLVPIQALPEWLADRLQELINPGQPLPAACQR